MNTFEIQSWPTRDLRISTHKVCSLLEKFYAFEKLNILEKSLGGKSLDLVLMVK
jgi:hypothetical protein